MKPFEENYTAWIDGTLSPGEQARFEAELEARGENGRESAEADRAAVQKLGGLLRTHFKAPPLRNADFFNHEILRRIEEAEKKAQKETSPAAPAAVSSASFRWPFARLIWATASALAVAALLMVALGLSGTNPDGSYYAQILEAKPGDGTISAVVFHSERENVTVLWLDGLDYLPAEGRR